MPSIVVLTGAVLLIGFAAAGAAGGTTAKRSVTLRLVEKSVGFNFVDNPPRQGVNAPPLMGDQFAITSEMQTSSGARAGQLDATCTVTQGGANGGGVCTGIFSLKGGLITGIARLRFNSNTTLIAITGGTGAYEGITGSGTSVSRSADSPYSDDTLHLIWP
jgi:hypothetical protein